MSRASANTTKKLLKILNPVQGIALYNIARIFCLSLKIHRFLKTNEGNEVFIKFYLSSFYLIIE